MKDKILQLRNQGLSYRQIQTQIKCSRGLISYYLNPEGKTKTLERQNKNRHVKRAFYKTLAGGKCSICGYNKCIDALQFHHRDPSQKDFEISQAIWGEKKMTKEQILTEIKKCDLVCANCHAELHSRYHFV